MVIVGAGECGTRAAFALREEGYPGPVTLVGTERHLPYERPPLSKEGMAAERPGMKAIAEAGRFESAGIRLLLANTVASIDRAARSVRCVNGDVLAYDRLLLATGASPRRLAAAEELKRCAYLRTHDDAEAIAGGLRPEACVAIVGGGFIGLELAAAARRRGCGVVLLEALPRLLARAVPAEIAATVEATHRNHGVDLRTGVSIEAISEDASEIGVRLTDGSDVAADLLVIGIGAVPNTELASAAGLGIDNGIRVDESLRTEDEAIYAAGDCCSFPLAIYGGRRVRLEAWRNAQEQGTLAARNMLGYGEKHVAVPWFWSDQYDLTLQIAGLCDEGATIVRRNLDDHAYILFHLAGDGRLVAASGIGPGSAVARDIRIAEMLITRSSAPPPQKLAAAETKLKSLLAA